MSLQGCSYEIGMVKRAHLVCLAAVERRIGHPAIIPSPSPVCAWTQPGTDSFPPRCHWTVCLWVCPFYWWVDLSVVFALYFCAPSVLCACSSRSLDSRGVVRSTGVLSMCLSLPVELMFDQGENEREREMKYNSQWLLSVCRQSCDQTTASSVNIRFQSCDC